MTPHDKAIALIAVLAAACLAPVGVRADDGEECMGDVVYCFMVVIYSMAMGTSPRTLLASNFQLSSLLMHPPAPSFRHPDRRVDGAEDHPVPRAAPGADRGGPPRRHHAAVSIGPPDEIIYAVGFTFVCFPSATRLGEASRLPFISLAFSASLV